MTIARVYCRPEADPPLAETMGRKVIRITDRRQLVANQAKAETMKSQIRVIGLQKF